MVSWLTGYFKHSNQQDKSLRGNLTFGQTTFSKTFRPTGQFFRQQVWVWPLVAFVILATLGYFVNGSIKHSIESSLQSELSTLLHVERSMVEKWLQHQESNAIALASLPDVRAAVLKILDYQESMSAGKGLGTGEKPLSEEIEEWRGKLKQFLLPGMSAHHFIGYIVVDREQRVIAAQTKEIVGQVVSHNTPRS